MNCITRKYFSMCEHWGTSSIYTIEEVNYLQMSWIESASPGGYPWETAHEKSQANRLNQILSLPRRKQK